MSVPTVYVVNLRGDQDRWEGVQDALASFGPIKAVRIEAVYGSSLPHDVCLRLTGDPYSVVYKGALGCQLSHVRAWEYISRGDEAWVMVVEDDASLARLDCLAALELPAGLDFAFCNNRTQPEGFSTWAAIENPVFAFHPLVETLSLIEGRRQAVGTDGYLISREGARKFTALFKQHGYFSHVDLRMLAYAVDGADLDAKLAEGSWLRNDIAQIQRVVGRTKAVAAAVLSPAMSFHEGTLETARTREDRQGRLGGDAPGS